MEPMDNSDLNFDEIKALFESADRKSTDRRKKRDFIAWLPFILSTVALLMTSSVWFILDQNAPRNYGWLTLFGYFAPEQTWPVRPVNVCLYLIIASIVLCVVALLLNRLRMRRRGDKYWLIIFIVGVLAILTLVFFLIQFVPMGILGKW